MAKRAILAATAVMVGSFNPVLATAAWASNVTFDGIPPATGPTDVTLTAAQQICTDKATAHGSAWTGTLDESSMTPTYVSGPTEVGGHSIDDAIDGTLVGVGFTPGTIGIDGDPFRIGGSVNLFGIQVAHGGSFASSTYDFEGDFNTVYSYAFTCNMSEEVTTLVQGYYVVADDAPGNSGDAIKANCDSFTAMGNDETRPPWWGLPEDHAFCHFIMTQEGGTGPEDRPDEYGSVEETQTDTLTAHENDGEGYTIDDNILLGQVVVCISPTTSTQTKKGVPGTWTPKNGYDGSKCNTPYFNSAPWGAGSQTSKGTYISVPGV
jgi:hypothetical protein